jgi:hypothetical protein
MTLNKYQHYDPITRYCEQIRLPVPMYQTVIVLVDKEFRIRTTSWKREKAVETFVYKSFDLIGRSQNTSREMMRGPKNWPWAEWARV